MKWNNVLLSVLVLALIITCGPAQQQSGPVPTPGTEGKFFKLNDIPVTELVPGADSRLFNSDNVQISWLYMHPNIEFPQHNHPEEQLMIVREGSITQTVAGKTVIMEAGDALILPSNVMHGGVVGPDGCHVIDVFYPVREDYLEKVREQHGDAGFSF